MIMFMDMSNSSLNNIIFVTISMVGGGTERVISVLANEAARKGHKVTIMLIGDDRVEYELDEAVRVICVSKATGGRLMARISRIKAMRNVIKNSGKADVIAMGSSASIFAIVAAFGLKNRVVASERNDPVRFNLKPIKPGMKIIREFLYSRAYRLILQTEDAKKYFGKRVVERSRIIMNPLPDDIYLRRKDCKREKTVIGAGRFVLYKGADFLIDSFAQFNKIHPEYILKIFGKGELEGFLREKVAGYGLNDKVIFCGFCDDMYGELLKGGMYVSPSRSEGVSNALMEAMCLGIPVIATDCPIGGSRMCIDNGVTGLLTGVDDKDAMVKAMCKVAEDSSFSEMITRNAAKKSDEWTVEKIWKQWEKLFD